VLDGVALEIHQHLVVSRRALAAEHHARTWRDNQPRRMQIGLKMYWSLPAAR
jgi:hypothetical protein